MSACTEKEFVAFSGFPKGFLWFIPDKTRCLSGFFCSDPLSWKVFMETALRWLKPIAWLHGSGHLIATNFKDLH